MNIDITTLLYCILGLPVLFSIIAALNIAGKNLLHWLNRIAATAVGAAVIQLVCIFDPDVPYSSEYLYLDALSMWMVIIISTLYFAFAWTSKAYLDRDTNARYGYLRRFVTLRDVFMHCLICSC